MKQILARLFNHEELTSEETRRLMLDISNGQYPEAQTAALMAAFQMRGITVDELIGFRQALMETCVPVACCTTASGNTQTSNVYIAQSLPERVASHIYNAVKAQFNNLPWTNGGAQERNDIKAEVNNLIEQNHLSERVAATMRKLMEKNNWKTTEKE